MEGLGCGLDSLIAMTTASTLNSDEIKYGKVRVTRRKWLKLLGAGLGTTATAAFYVRYVEPEWLSVGHVNIPRTSATTGKALKILHISDFHVGKRVRLHYIAHALETGLSLNPDLACITGDILHANYLELDQLAEVLSILGRQIPTFASLGNHDGGWWSKRFGGYPTTKPIRGLLKKSSIELLDNCAQALNINGRKLAIIGVGDHWAGEFSPGEAFKSFKAVPDAYRLLLSHNPDTKRYLKPYPWDLMLCGHTHGGQVVIPFFGPPILPVVDKEYIAGLYPWEGRLIHITKGVGGGVRFNCRPEISLLTLT